MNESIDPARRRLLLASVTGCGLLATSPAWAMAMSQDDVPRTSPVVATGSGPVRGLERSGVNAFLGIPYGAPTAGGARFKPPTAPAPWTEVRDADRFGDRCTQNAFPEILSGGDEQVGSSEECLVLNVWTPALEPDGRRPVMVWFHGGGFVIGHGGQRRYDGTNLASAEDVVVVTINHRLGPFGFLHLGGLDPRFRGAGVLGLLDCIAALEWVRDNIAAFGGDPANVTVFGQSGGGAKISTLMAMPAAAGLFHKAIVQSGSWLKGMEPETGTDNALKVLRELEIDRSDLGALTAVPADRLLAAANAAIGPGLAAFGPVVDGEFLPRHPWWPDAPAPFAEVPMLIGTTKDETTLFALLAGGPEAPDFSLDESGLARRLSEVLGLPAARAAPLIQAYRRAHDGATPSDIFFRATSDAAFRTAAIRQAERKVAQGRAAAYVYLFTWESPAMGGRLRSSHSSEVPFVFNNPDASPLNGEGAGQAAMARLMSRTWAAFARTGDPNGPHLPRWKPYDLEERATMVLDARPEAVSDPLGEARALLETLVPA